jgi:hypothetical protein
MSNVDLPKVWPLGLEAAHELVDKFAIAALPALIARYGEGDRGSISFEDVAKDAYQIAYEMMQAKAEFQGDVL